MTSQEPSLQLVHTGMTTGLLTASAHTRKLNTTRDICALRNCRKALDSSRVGEDYASINPPWSVW